MVAGHLQEKNGYFYAVLSYKDTNGKRKTKWIPTGYPVKGNKKKAEAFLTEQRKAFEIPTVDAPATPDEKAVLGKLSPSAVSAKELDGEPITAVLTTAPGNGAPIGGLKVATATGWFAARPSGTEDVYKIYAESFKGPDHLATIQEQAREVVSAALKG